MSPTDKFIAENEFFTCTGDPERPCRMTVAECVRRQKMTKNSKDGMTIGSWMKVKHDLSMCVDCRVGKKNKSKAVQEVRKVFIPGMYESYNVKRCACGGKIIRKHGTRFWTWSQKKYCTECAKLTPAKRKEKIATLKQTAEIREIFMEAARECGINA